MLKPNIQTGVKKHQMDIIATRMFTEQGCDYLVNKQQWLDMKIITNHTQPVTHI